MCRHSDEYRANPETTRPEEYSLVQSLRRGASRRKLVLLECAIIRRAPFAECGRTIWKLLPEQPWFAASFPPAELIRAMTDNRNERSLASAERLRDVEGDLRRGSFTPGNAHRAIELLEKHVDGVVDDDQLLIAEHYFHCAEHHAEAEMFELEPETRDTVELSYCLAYWIFFLQRFGPRWWNTLDFYLSSYPGTFPTWTSRRPFHPQHRKVALELIAEILGPPSHLALDPAWRTSTVSTLASKMYESRDFSAMPILADALEDAGCSDKTILHHCRSGGRHVRGCWVVDFILSKAQ